MNIHEIKDDLLCFFKEEYEKAWVDCDQKRLHQLDEAMSLFEPVTTKSECLQLLVSEPTKLFASLREWRRMVAYIRENFSAQDLQLHGIFLDFVPEKEPTRGSQCLFINSQPTLCEYALSEDMKASFLGRWLVDVYQAEVVALDGAHINLRGSMAVGQLSSKNASITPRHDVYYQPVLSLSGAKFRMAEQMAQSKTAGELLCEILESHEVLQKPIMLDDLQATPIMEKGDQLIAESGHYALIRNVYEREYLLLRKLSEQRVIDTIQSTNHHLKMSSDVGALHVCMIRDQFLRLPNERLEIGVNHLGQPAYLSFDVNKHCFNTHGLYYENWNDKWAMEEPIYLQDNQSLEEMIKAIQEMHQKDLSSGVQKARSQSAKR